ncbi:MAG: hypothetical protein E6J78_16905 [Deltaproteobacteria bacterium]|nr:MAG: hypothetical protein E6J78_16905 [Deltaproteobacteria bacterium]
MMAALFLLLAAGAATAEPVRVERRVLIKEKRWFVSGGFAWLERGDYYLNPGFALSASYYPTEEGGPEIRVAGFVSRLSAAGDEVFKLTGLMPDSHRPISLVTAGWRQSLSYGKLAIGSSVLHFDLQGALHGGALVTDRSVAPALSASGGALMRITARIHAQLDLGLLASYERRSRASIAVGFLPLLSIGVAL